MLAAPQWQTGDAGKAKRRSRARNASKFDVRADLFARCGGDLPCSNGIDTTTARKVIAEVVPKLSRLASAKRFASRMGLCPITKTAGGKVFSGAAQRRANRVARALHLAAAALHSSPSALGACYRRLCARPDRAKAITATAHKLARLISSLRTKGTECTGREPDYCEEGYRQRVLHPPAKRAGKLGLQFVPIPQPA